MLEYIRSALRVHWWLCNNVLGEGNWFEWWCGNALCYGDGSIFCISVCSGKTTMSVADEDLQRKARHNSRYAKIILIRIGQTGFLKVSIAAR
ncbi:MAG: hypothetical protein LBJ39_03050 [Tannerellaceae bacterium]|nr:hypothetical protein [Tannerellaceae bacterium]